MKLKAPILAIAFSLLQIIPQLSFSQEKLLMSHTRYFLIARFDDPVETKYSPLWEKLEGKDFKEIIPAPLSDFPKLGNSEDKNSENWYNLSYRFLQGFILEPHNYGDYAEEGEQIYPYLISYGILGNGNYTGTYYQQNFETVNTLFQYFSKSENGNSLLNYMKPIVLWSLSCMSEASRNSYKDILLDAIEYINALKNDKFLQEELNFCKSKKDFTYRNSKGEVDGFRKIKAFIFRRYIDFEAQKWTINQIEEFETETEYRPKPDWGISIADQEKYGNELLRWF